MQPVAPWKYIRRQTDISLNPITYSGLATPQDLHFLSLKQWFLEIVDCRLTSFLLLLAAFGRYAQSSLPVWALNINTPQKTYFLALLQNKKLRAAKWCRDVCAAMRRSGGVIHGVIFACREMSPRCWMSLKEGTAPNINLPKLSYTRTDTNSVNTKQDIHSVTLCWTCIRNFNTIPPFQYAVTWPAATNEKAKLCWRGGGEGVGITGGGEIWSI